MTVLTRPMPPRARPILLALVPVIAIAAASGCGGSAPVADAATVQDSTHRVATVTGLSGPEAVRYDSIGDVYFVANFNGDPAGDANGFISRVTADGVIDSLRFATGTEAAPLHGPRGMYIVADTLWVADAAGVHGFHRVTGAPVRFIDFSAHAPGFLNDVVQGADGALYVTDTGEGRVYRIAPDGAISVALEGNRRVGAANGITRDGTTGRLLLAGWRDGGRVLGWDPASGEISDRGLARTGKFDGIEVVGAGVLVASQSDSSLHLIASGAESRIIRTPGAPADIGVDTRRGRVAVPYIALDRVDIWTLPVP